MVIDALTVESVEITAFVVIAVVNCAATVAVVVIAAWIGFAVVSAPASVAVPKESVRRFAAVPTSAASTVTIPETEALNLIAVVSDPDADVDVLIDAVGLIADVNAPDTVAADTMFAFDVIAVVICAVAEEDTEILACKRIVEVSAAAMLVALCPDATSVIAVVRLPARVAMLVLDDCSAAPVPSIVADALALALSEDCNLIAVVSDPVTADAVALMLAFSPIVVLSAATVVAVALMVAFGLIAVVSAPEIDAAVDAALCNLIAVLSAAAFVAVADNEPCSCAGVPPATKIARCKRAVRNRTSNTFAAMVFDLLRICEIAATEMIGVPPVSDALTVVAEVTLPCNPAPTVYLTIPLNPVPLHGML